MSSKREKRIRGTNQEYEDLVYQASKKQIISTKPDEELYVIDTIGSKTQRKKVLKLIQNNQKQVISKVEQKLLKKYQNKVNQNIDIKSNKNIKSQLWDVWNETTEVDKDTIIETNPKSLMKTRLLENKKKVFQLPHPGQSYNPSLYDHQNVLATAVALEIKKREKDIKDKTPFFQVSHDDIDEREEENNESNDDEEINTNGIVSMKKKVAERLTRAQKNKMRLKNLAKLEREKKEKEKALDKSISKLPLILKDLESKEKELQQQREVIKVKKVKKVENKLSYKEASNIPLSDELRGSLRTIIPKGVPIKNQVIDMVDQGQILTNKDRRNRKHKVHGLKKVVWIPKYKYS